MSDQLNALLREIGFLRSVIASGERLSDEDHVRINAVIALAATPEPTLDAPVECGICGDYSVKGIEVHDGCLAELVACDEHRRESDAAPDAAWATDLTDDETGRLAEALRRSDFMNWSADEVAARIAGTVRAIAAARLHERTEPKGNTE